MEEVLRHIVWPVSPNHECPYLPDRTAHEEIFLADEMVAADYQFLMGLGWRRSGRLFYRCRCPGCRECVPIRLRPDSFVPSRSQRRVWRRNQDLDVSVGRPVVTDEKHDIYARYLRERHDGTMSEGREEMEQFLYTSPVDTMEICFRRQGRLLGVGIADVSSSALSTVYFYFDPDERRRGLGMFSILWEIDLARRNGLDHYYLGYLIGDLPSMSYKADFRPHELLDADGEWRMVADGDE